MKVVILAGGLGTRLSEYTDLIPKPMVTVGGMPIIWHIMKTYSNFGFNDFCIALGYKAEIIKDYFLNFKKLNSDFSINLGSGEVKLLQEDPVGWNVTLIDTGASTMTGGRLKRMKKYIGNETFMVTYGDGVANINIQELVNFHKSHGKMVTVTAVRPSARFGELNIDELGNVRSFKEKPQMHQGWINGGFFVCEPSLLDLIEDDSVMLEHEPLEVASKKGELIAFKHSGYWQCMDTKRDQDLLNSQFNGGDPPWHRY
ncbi:glucose-1-phosphate cytidylyltransferase [Polynucleobacter sp. MWH-UH2A]|uniref:glucose-1-phosphate cytidylyltransferase n=1 Tax=Polynucleobacter sp. MWH-UH2A TaxID=1855617 RepID=UPI001BFE08E1|nr:glucose-1-phosphate cytidylyltransferase [Polynucleobacter sp. MWH-UH2A]QWD64380.1 glucose-1-phosphate cytidylyltransferase [Polynucleobacter sp. MWH-UH2A]